jgi:transcriptional regulator with GAF, ATPase, and Fis domain
MRWRCRPSCCVSQDRVVERIGGRERSVDVRVVCATNKDLSSSRRARFATTCYRISEVVVRIPPLRERGGDAVVIAQAVLDRRAREHGRPTGIYPGSNEGHRVVPLAGQHRELRIA